MFKLFSGGAGEEEASWPVSSVVGTLQSHYPDAELLGEDGPLKVYGVRDNGVNFVVALMQSAPGSGKITEVGFLARFVGFSISLQRIESLNGNLHISVASLEGNDLFLMAGLRVTGVYDAGQFSVLINAWRRDLAMALHTLSGDHASFIEAFPAARLEAARAFAVNAAPASQAGEGAGESETGGGVAEMLNRFMAGGAQMRDLCDESGDRDERGLIARLRGDSEGRGFVSRIFRR